MIRNSVCCMFFLLAFAAFASAETWKKVSVVDNMCYSKVKADPDQHSTRCALSCARSGYGIIAADGSYLKLDEAGNSKVETLLKATDKKDHLRLDVTGDRSGEIIKVKSVSLE